MKKIILSAALLGSVYFANAQVGIGTPTPANSAMLEVNSASKGVLIPRIELTSKTAFAPVYGTPVNSLLIYNTATVASDNTANPAVVGVTPGFYFWNTDKWERVTDESQLTELLNTDIKKLIDLLSFAYPSHNLGIDPLVDHSKGGGMVYTPAKDAVGQVGDANYSAAQPAKFSFVAFKNATTTNGVTTDNYEHIDITEIIKDLIKSSETKTKVITVNNVNYYLSETFNKFTDIEVAGLDDAAKQAILDDTTTTGYFKIDVAQSETKTKVITVNNVQYYLSETFDKFANIEAAGSDDALKQAALDSALAGSYFKIDVVGGVINNIVDIFNTPTTIQVVDGTETHNFTTVEEYVKYIVNNGTGSVGFTVDPIAADPTTGQAYIPGNSLYYTLDNGVKVEINVAKQLISNTTLITPTGNDPLTPEQIAQNTIIQNNINQIKTNLGDNFYAPTTFVKTGDTWIDGKPIFKAVISSSVTKGTANLFNATATSAGSITIPAGVTGLTVIGVKVIDYKGVTSSVTDLKVIGNEVYFRIGAGNMYTVLVPGDTNLTENPDAEKITVLVEYSGTLQ